MTVWWNSMALRERLLIAIAGGLSLLVIVWQFMLVPALSARADARSDLAQSSQTLSRLQEAYMARRVAGAIQLAVPTSQSGVSSEAFKGRMTRAASDKGLSITRLQSGDDGIIGVVFERADPRLLFFWLEEVETSLGGQIIRMTMEQAGDGAVRLNVDIEGGAT